MTADQAQAVQLVVGSLLGTAGVGVLAWAAKSVVSEIRALVEKVARQDAYSGHLDHSFRAKPITRSG